MVKTKHSTFYVVRHGETDWNMARRLQGHTDIPLNDHGKAQARRLRAELAHIDFGAAYASDLQRARHTAELVVSTRGLSVTPLPELRECCMGPAEGTLVPDFEKQYQAQLHHRMHLTSLEERFAYKLHPQIESYGETLARVEPCLKRLASEHHGQNILVVSHGGVMRVLLLRLLGTQHTVMVKNGGVLRFSGDGKDWQFMDTVGIDLSHLER